MSPAFIIVDVLTNNPPLTRVEDLFTEDLIGVIKAV
jgi:hypothetical protein